MNLIMLLDGSIIKCNPLIVLVLLLILRRENMVSSVSCQFVMVSFFWIVVLKLYKRMGEQQFLTVGNINDYSLIYKSLPDVPAANTCLIIDISKATRRVSLEEKFRLERRSNHYVCKMSKIKLIF